MSELPESTQPETARPETAQQETAQQETDQPETGTDGPRLPDDQGEALERSAASIREARDAEGTVAANDDITARDDERAGEYSEDPEGEGGHP